ncbi:MAG: outer membrane protein transport protein [Granulosicoccus sp.]
MKLHLSTYHWLSACGLLAASIQAQAAGFALIEHGASGMGNAYAGAAAVSSDTSTAWFNPAGMTEIDNRELAAALHVLNTDTEWTNAGTTLFNGEEVSGSETASAGTTSPLPNLYYVAPINDQWSYGLSFGAPFGSSTEYDDNWKGRYTTLKSGVSAIDINPSVAYRLSDKVRLGGGISLQIMSVELESAIDSTAACFGSVGAVEPQICIDNFAAADGSIPFGNQATDSSAELTGDSTAISFNLGALFLPTPELKIGVAYRHSTSHELDGDADFSVDPTLRAVLDAAGAEQFLADRGITAEIDLPPTLMISGAYNLNDRIQLLADYTWTGWSSFEELRVTYDNPAAQPDTVSIQDWNDVSRISAGINFKLNEKLMLRGGVALDEEAIPSPERRTARIPGNDRTWIAFGAGYQINKNISLDFGYAHLFLDETPIDNPNTESPGGSHVRGEYDSGVDIVSAQFNWAFN